MKIIAVKFNRCIIKYAVFIFLIYMPYIPVFMFIEHVATILRQVPWVVQSISKNGASIHISIISLCELSYDE
jgi:hypothetical protein